MRSPAGPLLPYDLNQAARTVLSDESMGLQDLRQLLSRARRARFLADAHVRRHQLGAEHEPKPAHLEDAERIIQSAACEGVGTRLSAREYRGADTHSHDDRGEPRRWREPLASEQGGHRQTLTLALSIDPGNQELAMVEAVGEPGRRQGHRQRVRRL